MSNIFQSIENFLQSEAGQAVAQAAAAPAAQRVLTLAQNTVDGLIADEVQNGDPSRSEQAVVDDIDGRVWHNARGVLGWAGFTVDILRHQPSIDGPIRALITQRLTALAEKEPSADPSRITSDPTGAQAQGVPA